MTCLAPSPPRPTGTAALLDDLRKLGVDPGDVLFVHSSFKSLGPVEGGTAAIIAALEQAVGPEGTLNAMVANFARTTQRSLQFIRWLRCHILGDTPYPQAVELLRPYMKAYIT